MNLLQETVHWTRRLCSPVSAGQLRCEGKDPSASISPGLVLSSASSHRSLHIICSIYFCRESKRTRRRWWEPKPSIAIRGPLRPSSPSTLCSWPASVSHWLFCPRVQGPPDQSPLRVTRFLRRSKGGDRIGGKILSERCRRVSLSIFCPLNFSWYWQPLRT